MRNLRSYYSATIAEFLQQSDSEILGIIHSNDISAETTIQQSNTWESEVQILKNQLRSFSDGRIIFEYTIPRMGKRVDTVVLYKNIVFLLEFKVGDKEYRQSTYDQVYDYALDLRNFQKESHDKLIVPIMVSTNAPRYQNTLTERERIIEPIRCNAQNLGVSIKYIAQQYNEPEFNYALWENSEYLPTPTIVEAAQALYRGHNVHEITRSDAGAENLTVTTDEINRIIEHSKANGRKSICFVTGVPGAGKTLVGLNIAIQRSDAQQGEHAVFLSGNFPLVTVLQEALARDKVEQEKQRGGKLSKSEALRSTSAFIQIIHKYRDSFVSNNNVPPERVAIFDEAQRAWTQDMIEKFMATKKGVSSFPYSEPEFLISTMDRHQDWAVIICLVGGGQEINTGEAGLPEWFDSLRRAFPNWDVYITPQLNDNEYRRGRSWSSMLVGLNTFEREKLHLATSVRSFRTPDLAAFVKAVLDAETDEAKRLYQQIKNKYPIVITRDLDKAKALISLQRIRNKRLQEYCEVKCKQYQECSEDNKNKDVLINSYQKAFNIITTINSAMDNMKKEAADSDNTFPEDFRCRYNRNRLYRVGLMHDAFMVIGFMSALGLLCMYNFLEIPSSIPNYLTVLGFGLIILVYASRDRAETMVQEAEEYVKNECKKVDEKLLNEQKIIRLINTALCESAEFLKTEADVRLFLFVMQIIEDD